MAGPLEQFEIHTIVPLHAGSVDVSFTNSSAYMVAAAALSAGFLILGTRRRTMVPGRWQAMAEMSYEFVAGLIRETIGTEGRKYFPLIFTLFMFILFGNMLGMIPYSFTFTSHIAVTFVHGASCRLPTAVTILGFVRHGVRFFANSSCRPARRCGCGRC